MKSKNNYMVTATMHGLLLRRVNIAVVTLLLIRYMNYYCGEELK